MALAGVCASLVGIGLARFAYTPLLPALVAAGWFRPSDAAYLGAANLAGYLIGALAARPLADRLGARATLRAMMLLATCGFFGCAARLPFAWYFGWRFAAGAAGGAIMVLAATTILPHVAAGRRGLVGGFIFTGVGLGIAASGTLVPLLLEGGLVSTWCVLGEISAVLTAVAWGCWPPDGSAARTGQAERACGRRGSPVLRALLLEYGLNAVGLVPAMVFLSDYVARGLGRGIAAGAHESVLYGAGAIAGPLVAGRVADRIGFGPALRVGLAVQAVAIALPAASSNPLPLAVSSVVVGGFTPGIVPLVLGRIQELMPSDPLGQRREWGRATIAFALFQAASAYGYSFLLARSATPYSVFFLIGGGAVALALATDLIAGAAVRGGRAQLRG